MGHLSRQSSTPLCDSVCLATPTTEEERRYCPPGKKEGLLDRGKTSVQDRRHLLRGAVNQSPFVTKAIGEPDGLCEKFLSSSANRKSARRILPSSRTAPYFWDLFFREKATIKLGFQVQCTFDPQLRRDPWEQGHDLSCFFPWPQISEARRGKGSYAWLASLPPAPTSGSVRGKTGK